MLKKGNASISTPGTTHINLQLQNNTHDSTPNTTDKKRIVEEDDEDQERVNKRSRKKSKRSKKNKDKEKVDDKYEHAILEAARMIKKRNK